MKMKDAIIGKYVLCAHPFKVIVIIYFKNTLYQAKKETKRISRENIISI